MLTGKTIVVKASYDKGRVIGKGECVMDTPTHVHIEIMSVLGKRTVTKFPRDLVEIEVETIEPDLKLNQLPLTTMPTPNGIRKKRSSKVKSKMHPDEPGWLNYSMLSVGQHHG